MTRRVAFTLEVLWIVALLLWVGVSLFPLSTGLTRAAGIALFVVVWLGLLALVWRSPFWRIALLILSASSAVFLMLPARGRSDVDSLRGAYVSGLQRYEGMGYVWGGESPMGIDCSGLVRRGLVDASFLRGIGTLDAGLVRSAMRLWWNDCTARELGEGQGRTTRLFSAPSLKALDPASLLPGDLAVTRTGIHIMAYLGDGRWIEADPVLGRVVTLSVAQSDSAWLETPMNLVRWNVLQP